jgi:NADPH:quinone reductase-like Zn-dependent oxidoreductase
MRAAVIEAMNTLPVVRSVGDPETPDGDVLVQVSSAGVNPTDLVASTGVRGNLPVPYVPGTEGVGWLGDGTRVYFAPTRLPHGSMAEYAPVNAERAFGLPDGLNDADALGIGIAGSTAWLAMSWKGQLRPGESVLILGATGSVGQVAVQAARLMGASRIVAAGRNVAVLETLRDYGADDLVVLDAGYEQRLIAAAAGGFDLVVDSLFAAPMAAALRATVYGGRIVNLGMRAGRMMELNGLAWKGRDLLNYNMDLPPLPVYRAAYDRMVQYVLAGELAVRTRQLALDEVASAWEQQASSPNTKLVLRIRSARLPVRRRDEGRRLVKEQRHVLLQRGRVIGAQLAPGELRIRGLDDRGQLPQREHLIPADTAQVTAAELGVAFGQIPSRRRAGSAGDQLDRGHARRVAGPRAPERQQQPEVEQRIADGGHLPVDHGEQLGPMRGKQAVVQVEVAVHHRGRLGAGLVVAQPLGHPVERSDVTALVATVPRLPARHLTAEEPGWPAELGQSGGLPVRLLNPHQRINQGGTHRRDRFRADVVGGWQRIGDRDRLRHVLEHEELGPENAEVLAVGHRPDRRDRRRGQSVQQRPLPGHAVSRAVQPVQRRPPDDPLAVPGGQQVGDVGVAPRELVQLNSAGAGSHVGLVG